MDLVLASASPRRKELLQQIGVEFDVRPMNIDETVRHGELPQHYVLRLAKEKALAPFGEDGQAVQLNVPVLAADTTVVLNQAILNKPKDTGQAIEMLSALSGKSHWVYTGIALAKQIDQLIKLESQVVASKVTFLPLERQQIERYVASGEPMDKAGAYGIQGKGSVFVQAIEGSYSNVVGLPLAETAQLLEEFNVPYWGN